MAVGDFDLFYSDEPFSIMDKNQRNWYDPILIDVWRQRSVFRPIIRYTKNNAGPRAKTMTVTQVLDPHADTTPLALRQLWMESMHVDSRAIDITFQHNGLKVAYHKYDDMITYWKKNNAQGLAAIARGALGVAETDMNDMLARNALIGGAHTTGYELYINDREDFSEVVVGDVFDPDIGSDIWLGMAQRDVPGAMNPSGNGAGGVMVCYTTPGVIYDIQSNSGWISVNEYLQNQSLMNYEVGTYKNVRYVATNKCVLWNCGTLIAQAPISVAANAGDGSPDPSTTKVDGTYKTGQDGVTHYLQLGTFDTGTIASLSVNDIITIHKTRTAANGVTNGVNYQEGTLMNRRIVSIDTDNGRIALDQPLLVDYNIDLGAGVFGYVTLGRNIHASIYVGGPNAIVAGVFQQPQLYAPQPIDDFGAIHRFSMDQYLGYQPFAPEVFEVVYSAGSTRVKGAREVQ